jgi:branched-chain amino acid aminotransferase
LKDHLNRLYASAKYVSLKIPMTMGKLESLVNLSLKKNSLKDAYIRLLVTRGAGDLGLDPRACPKPSVVIIADKLALFPKRCYSEGLSAIIAKTRRTIPEALNPAIKSMNYLNNILAKIEANRQGVPEAIMLNVHGHVAECTGDNVFYVKGQNLVTPPVEVGILEGITRKTVIELIRNQTSYSLEEKLFTPDELFLADEVFFTGTAAEVIPVTKIDKRSIGRGRPGPVTQHLIDLFKRFINRNNK